MKKAQHLVGMGEAPEEGIPSGVGESVPIARNHEGYDQGGIRGVDGHLCPGLATRHFREFEIATEAGLEKAHHNEGDDVAHRGDDGDAPLSDCAMQVVVHESRGRVAHEGREEDQGDDDVGEAVEFLDLPARKLFVSRMTNIFDKQTSAERRK